MAPVPQPTTSMPAQTAQLPSSLKWFFLVMLGIFSVSLVILALVWITRKTKKSISAFLERLEERKLVLPTSLDPWKPRPIILPLPENFMSTTRNSGSIADVKPTTAEDDEADKPNVVLISDKCTSMWWSTSLDHIDLDECLECEEFVDTGDALYTPTLSPSLDSDTDSDDSSLQTPPLDDTFTPVSHSLGYPPVVDDDYGSTTGFLGSMTASAAFSDYLCYANIDDYPSDDKLLSTLDSSQLDDTLLLDADIPTIVITEDPDDYGPNYSYESSDLVSTPSTAALYELGLPIPAHKFPTSPSHSLIPIPFAPTLPTEYYIYVPPLGSEEYFHSFSSSFIEDDSESEEEPPPDLSRLGLRSTSDSRKVASDDDVFNWDRLFEQEAGLQQCTADTGLRASSNNLASPPSTDPEHESPIDLSRLGLRPTSDSIHTTIFGSSPRRRRRLPPDKHTSPLSAIPEESPPDLLRPGLLPASDSSDVTSEDTRLQTPTPYNPP